MNLDPPFFQAITLIQKNDFWGSLVPSWLMPGALSVLTLYVSIKVSLALPKKKKKRMNSQVPLLLEETTDFHIYVM